MAINLSYLFDKSILGVNLLDNHAHYKSFVNGKENEILINDGWKILFKEKYDESMDKYLNPSEKIDSLKDIQVPLSLSLQGYGVPHYINAGYNFDGRNAGKFGEEILLDNPVGLYLKDIEITEEDLSYRQIIDFKGFETGLYLYVNGEFVGYSENLYIDSYFDISKYLHAGVNRLAAYLFRYSTATWFLDQDFWKMHGIFRDISLFALPKENAIEDLTIDTDIKDFKSNDSTIHLGIVGDFSQDAKFKIQAEFDGKIIKEILTASTSISFDIPSANLWSAEIPNLYNLKIEVLVKNSKIMEISTPFGIKDVRIKDKTLIFNNKKLYINGANRHEWNMVSGRALTDEDDDFDIDLLKDNNFNAVRTSHYPNRDHFYDVADRKGLYILDENCFETHGSWMRATRNESRYQGVPSNDPEFVPYCVEKIRRFYNRDKNHPSIFIYSLGNEAGAGLAFREMHKELKRLNPKNIVHYEGTSWVGDEELWVSDVTSYMYTSPELITKLALEGDPKMNWKPRNDKPTIYCEFAHAMGNSCGNLDYFNKFRESLPLFQGGFVWDYIDQGLLYEKNGTKMLTYGGDFLDIPNDADFNCNGVILADRSLAKKSPKLRAFRHAYQPYDILVNENEIEIKNKNLFLNSEGLTVRISLNVEGVSRVLFEEPLTLPAGENIKIPCKTATDLDKEAFIQVEILKAKDGDWLAYEEKLISKWKAIEPSSNGEIKFIEGSFYLSESIGETLYMFRRANGSLMSIECGKDKYLTNAVMPTIFRPMTSNDGGNSLYRKNPMLLGASKYPFISWEHFEMEDKMKEDSPEFSQDFYLSGTPGDEDNHLTLTYKIYKDGTMKLTLATKGLTCVKELATFALTFEIPLDINSLEYYGKGPFESYPDRKDALKTGIYQLTSKENYYDYIRPQECGNHEDTRWLKLHAQESDLFIYAEDEKPFAFKFLPYNDFEIENAAHKEELPKPHHNYLTIAGFTRGVGGDDSWGADVHKEYRLEAKNPYSFSFYLKPIKK
ncbi:MAG: hypothetical protein K5694_02700 [Bacilli bacterium]|nr:hypothetical protein [Bacilli bacterium]